VFEHSWTVTRQMFTAIDTMLHGHNLLTLVVGDVQSRYNEEKADAISLECAHCRRHGLSQEGSTSVHKVRYYLEQTEAEHNEFDCE
jgi:hypothetical protein